MTDQTTDSTEQGAADGFMAKLAEAAEAQMTSAALQLVMSSIETILQIPGKTWGMMLASVVGAGIERDEGVDHADAEFARRIHESGELEVLFKYFQVLRDRMGDLHDLAGGACNFRARNGGEVTKTLTDEGRARARISKVLDANFKALTDAANKLTSGEADAVELARRAIAKFSFELGENAAELSQYNLDMPLLVSLLTSATTALDGGNNEEAAAILSTTFEKLHLAAIASKLISSDDKKKAD